VPAFAVDVEAIVPELPVPGGVDVDQCRGAVDRHRERFALEMDRADGRLAANMAEPDRPRSGSEPELPAVEQPIDGTNPGLAFGGHSCEAEQPHALQPVDELPCVQASLRRQDRAHMLPHRTMAFIEQLLDALQIGR
jgi:hypothetical protein